MSVFAKIMVVVNFILAVAFLAAAGTLLGAAEDYKAKYETSSKTYEEEKKSLNAQITARDNTIKETGARYTTAEGQRANLDTQLRTVSAQNDALAQQNKDLRAAYDKLAAAQQDMQSHSAEQNKTIDQLRNDLTTAEAGRRELESKSRAQADEIARLTQDMKTAEQNLAAANTEREKAATELENQRTTVARYQKEKGPLTGAVVMPDIKAVVSSADASHDIYILSVGSKDKVEAGFEFTIYRGNEYISTIVIDHVFDNYSSGTTKKGMKRKDVQPGDEAATRL